MSSENLFREIGMIDDDIIYEAEQIKDNRIWFIGKKKKWLYAAVTVSLILGSILSLHIHNSGNGFQANSIKYYSVDNPEKITCTFASKDMGSGAGIGHLIIKDYSEITSKNPTLNNTENISELPVFKNKEGLWSETYHNISSIDKMIYFNKPAYEVTYDYSYDGAITNSWNLCYKYDPSKSIVNQLLDYSFYRIEYSKSWNDDSIGWAKVCKPSFEPGILYPIISLSEAKEKLKKGEFFCYGDERTVAETNEIISVELIYLTDEYQTYLQPFYMFYITDASWNVKDVMSSSNYDEYKSVSPVFVPAVEDDYLKIVDTEVHFN